eukprot:309831-Chlamydomonas_euryale.AAC.4
MWLLRLDAFHPCAAAWTPPFFAAAFALRAGSRCRLPRAQCVAGYLETFMEADEAEEASRAFRKRCEEESRAKV